MWHASAPRGFARGVLAVGILAVTLGDAAAAELERTFAADAVELRRLAADIDVAVAAGAGEIGLRATGAPRDVESLTAEVRDGALVVTGPAHGVAHSSVSVGSVTTVVTGGNTVQTIVGGIDAAGRPLSEPLRLHVTVPPGTPLTVDAVVGDVTVGDLGAPLRAGLSGGGITAGRVTDAVLQVAGAGNIEVAAVEGDLDARVTGAGDIRVAGGRIGRLEAAIDGTGNIEVGAAAESARLALAGVGSIDVAAVAETPEIRQLGIGSITVGNR